MERTTTAQSRRLLEFRERWPYLTPYTKTIVFLELVLDLLEGKIVEYIHGCAVVRYLQRRFAWMQGDMPKPRRIRRVLIVFGLLAIIAPVVIATTTYDKMDPMAGYVLACGIVIGAITTLAAMMMSK